MIAEILNPIEYSQGATYGLTLADGRRLLLDAADQNARRIVNFWGGKARLKPIPPGELPFGSSPADEKESCAFVRLLAVTGELQDSPGGAFPKLRLPASVSVGPGELPCLLEPPGAPKRVRRVDIMKARQFRGEIVPEPLTEEEWFWRQLVRISASIGRSAQGGGGALVHSGLAEYFPGHDSERFGFLLAGRSGVGKSTAGRRLPPPWISLADDMTLIVRTDPGDFRAHPFPTWSRFFGIEAGDGSDAWDVQPSVPLRAVFVLEQGKEDRAEPLGPGHALSLLIELAEQASNRMTQIFPPEEIEAFNLQRFENICLLVKTIPAFLLQVRLDGCFWEEVYRVMRSGTGL